MSELLRLAGLCEKATGPDRELDEAIMAALFVREQRHIGCQEEQDDGSWSPVKDLVWVDPKTDRWVGTGAREFTSSIDDAMTLVPKGWDWWCGSRSQGGLYRVSVSGPVQFGNVCDMQAGSSPSRALALCAASLRASDTAGVR